MGIATRARRRPVRPALRSVTGTTAGAARTTVAAFAARTATTSSWGMHFLELRHLFGRQDFFHFGSDLRFERGDLGFLVLGQV